MGKTRSKKEVKKKSLRGTTGYNETLLKTTVGKLESDIGAISLGPPRSKILKRGAAPSSAAAGSLLSSNFASRIRVLDKQKKKVRFCQNIVAEELKEQKTSSEQAKHYFKVIHPSAIEKRINGSANNVHHQEGRPITKGNSILDSIIPDADVLMNKSARALRNIIKQTTKSKKTILRAKKKSFRKKLELIKGKEEELLKAKQRQQTVIVGDMEPMLQALPALTSNDGAEETDLTATKALEEKSKIVPNKTKYSVKKTQQAILDSLKFFEASGVTTGIGIPKT